MRKLLVTVLVVAALWTGYWWAGALAIEKAVHGGLANLAASGRTASAADVAVHGIPNRWDLRVDEIAIADPVAGWGWTSPFAQVYAMTWKPWHVLAALPSGQEITLADQTLSLTSDPIRASLRLVPSLDLGLNEFVVEAHSAALSSTAGWSMSVQDLFVAIRRDATIANGYRLGLKATDIAPDPSQIARITAIGLPDLTDEVYLDALVGLTAPIDRHLAETSSRLTDLEVTDLHVFWGDFRLTAAGKLTVGADGVPVGEIPFTVTGWRRLPPLLVALGIIPPEREALVNSGLQAFASQNGDMENIVLTLRIADGWMKLGPFPLGPAPVLH